MCLKDLVLSQRFEKNTQKLNLLLQLTRIELK